MMPTRRDDSTEPRPALPTSAWFRPGRSHPSRKSSKRQRRWTAGVAAALALAPGTALAQAFTPAFDALSPGLLFSYTVGEGVGLGTEITFMRVHNPLPYYGYGSFFQAERLWWKEPSHTWRAAAGLQAGSLVGVEAGLALHPHGREPGVSTAGHLGGYASIGFISLSLRGTFSLDGEAFSRLAWVLSLKAPLRISGGSVTPVPPGIGVAGRPLRIEDRHALATLAPSPTSPAFHSEAASLPEGVRALLAERWLASARAEASSVSSFIALADDLLAAGAPRELIDDALAAAGDELAHTAASLELASAYAGVRHQVSTFPMTDGAQRRANTRRDELIRLAVESWEDGCLGEGLAAADLRLRAETATGPVERATLEAIASEEEGHAELAWRIVSWCLAQGGQEVREALGSRLSAQ